MKKIIYSLASLKLTVILLAFSVLLVFLGTIDQKDFGIRYIQQVYFESFFAVWAYNKWLPFAEYLSWLRVPLPGGYSLGFLLLINLFSAHFRHYKSSLKKVGIVFVHAGVVLLLLGQLFTQIWQNEYFMWIDEGAKSNYIESFYENELVLTELGAEDRNIEYVFSSNLLEQNKNAEELSNDSCPLDLILQAYYPSSLLVKTQQLSSDWKAPLAKNGIAAKEQLSAVPVRKTYQHNQRDIASAYIELKDGEELIGTWLLSTIFRERQGDGSINLRFQEQLFTHKGKTYSVALRNQRKYLESSILLKRFKHEKYEGTEIPSNFSSDIWIEEEARDVHVYMNHPMYYSGFTFYQASFGNADKSSMFQVVKNPARSLPYIASTLISFGLIWQCVAGLRRLNKRQMKNRD